MNPFPLAPFLIKLEENGFRFTPDDYRRISIALNTGGAWTISRLRRVLLSLLLKDRDRKNMFLQCFDDFFDLPREKEAAFADIDVEKALNDLQQLGQGNYVVEEKKSPESFLRRVIPVSDRKISDDKSTKRKIGFLIAELVVAIFLLVFDYQFRQFPETTPITPIQKPAVTKIPEDQTRYRIYKNLPYIKEIKAVPSAVSENWKIFAGMAGFLLMTILIYALYLWKSHKIPDDKPPKFNENSPATHFRLGNIGGKLPPRLDVETLDNLADYLGYFQSEFAGKLLDVPATIERTVDNGCIPSPVFLNRRQVYNVLILEDALSEALLWNPIAKELAEGLAHRAISVIYARFHGSPARFRSSDGHTYHLEDLADQRKSYTVLIFSDGKALNPQKDRFALESLSRWHRVAWMELRDARFRDKTTEMIAKYFPLYPATKSGLIRALARFHTELGSQKDDSQDKPNWQQVPMFAGNDLPGYIEQLTGKALLWVQACSMIQPLSLGMAEALRKEFHPEIAPESIERLMALPQTKRTVSGVSFSTPVLSVLRRGFAVRRDKQERDKILNFILKKIGEAEPLETDSLAHLAWEFQVERMRLEIEPKNDLKRLAELAAPESPMSHFIQAEMANLELPSDDPAAKADLSRIPILIKPEDKHALQRFGKIVKNSGINILDAFPIARKHWVAMGMLGLMFIAISGWSLKQYFYFTIKNRSIRLTIVGNNIKSVPNKIKVACGKGIVWKAGFREGTDAGIPYSDFEVNPNSNCRISLFNEGQQILTDLGIISQNLEVHFLEKTEQRTCKETYSEIGLSIERCPEGKDQQIILPSWRETLGESAPKDRLTSIGVVIETSEGEKAKFKPLEDKLFATNSIDLLYRISLGTDGELHIAEALQKINEELGAWTENCQVLLFPNYINQHELNLTDLESFGRVLAFGDADKSEWIDKAVKGFESAKETLLSEKELLAFLPSVEIVGEGHPVVLARGETATPIAVADNIKSEIINSLKMKFVYIPPGEFMMGSPKEESGRHDSETQHKVTLTKGFYMQTTEVTQGQWKAVMGKNPSRFKDCGDICPVETVSWSDVQEFIKKLNQKEGTDKYRLPTEAEWEYAARAGTTTSFTFGKCLNTDQANYDGNYPIEGCPKGRYRGQTVPVGSFTPNAWGLYEIHGNVWEWCQDWYGEYPVDAVYDPVGPNFGSNRVLRGGTWKNGARYCRTANRFRIVPGGRSYYVGFRLACVP